MFRVLVCPCLRLNLLFLECSSCFGPRYLTTHALGGATALGALEPPSLGWGRERARSPFADPYQELVRWPAGARVDVGA